VLYCPSYGGRQATNLIHDGKRQRVTELLSRLGDSHSDLQTMRNGHVMEREANLRLLFLLLVRHEVWHHLEDAIATADFATDTAVVATAAGGPSPSKLPAVYSAHGNSTGWGAILT
jgi:hypothetical protein